MKTPDSVTDKKVTVTADGADTLVFAGRGTILAMVIDKAESGATAELQDSAGSVSHGIILDIDVKGRQVYNYYVRNGCSITIAGVTTSVRVHVFFKPEA